MGETPLDPKFIVSGRKGKIVQNFAFGGTQNNGWGNSYTQPQQNNQGQQAVMYMFAQLWSLMNNLLQQGVNSNQIPQQIAAYISASHNPDTLKNPSDPNYNVVNGNLWNLFNGVENHLKSQGMTLAQGQINSQPVVNVLMQYIRTQMNVAANALNMNFQGQSQGYNGVTNPFAGAVSQNNNPFARSLGAGPAIVNNGTYQGNRGPEGFQPPSQGQQTSSVKPIGTAGGYQQAAPVQTPQPQPKASPARSEKVSTGFAATPVVETVLNRKTELLNNPELKKAMEEKGLTVTDLYYNQQNDRPMVGMVVSVAALVGSEKDAISIARAGVDQNLTSLTMARVDYRKVTVFPASEMEIDTLAQKFGELDAWKTNANYGKKIHTAFADVVPSPQLNAIDRFIADQFNERMIMLYRERFNLSSAPVMDSLLDLEEIVEIAEKGMGNRGRAIEFTNELLNTVLSELFDSPVVEAKSQHKQAFVKGAQGLIFAGKDVVNALIDGSQETADLWMERFGKHHSLLIQNKSVYLVFDAGKDILAFDLLIDDRTRFDVTDVFTLLRTLQSKSGEVNMASLVTNGLLKVIFVEGDTTQREVFPYGLIWTKFGQEQRIMLGKNAFDNLTSKRLNWGME